MEAEPCSLGIGQGESQPSPRRPTRWVQCPDHSCVVSREKQIPGPHPEVSVSRSAVELRKIQFQHTPLSRWTGDLEKWATQVKKGPLG